MTKRLFTDFDGPIMDVSERYFQVYKFCLAEIKNPTQIISPLTKSEFWNLKRSQTSEVEIAIKSGLTLPNQSQAFAQLRRETIHTQPFFQYDCFHPWAIAALETAQNLKIELALITMRRERELFPVLAKYDLLRFFESDRIFCLKDDYVKTQDIKDKPLLMAQAIASLAPSAYISQQWIVGDTEADIIAGNSQNITTIGILSGIRNQTQLLKYQPHAIAPDLEAAIKIISV